MEHKRPVPLVKAFLICREILQDTHSMEFILIGPLADFAAAQYPCAAALNVFTQFSSLHGSYRFTVQLRDAEEQVHWSQTLETPIKNAEPLDVYRMAFRDLRIIVPEPGHYDLVLLTHEEEIARHPLWAREPPQPTE